MDKRTDIWGCVLYELLTGRRAFEGTTRTDTLAAVLEHEPDWTRLPPSIPTSIRRLLQRCLHEDPTQRLRDFGDVRILIDDALNEPMEERRQTDATKHRTWWPWAAGVVALLAIGSLAAYLRPRPSSSAGTLRVSVSAPGPLTPQLSGAISPDGRHLEFIAAGPSGKSMLWVRALASLEARELSGTERAAHPVWSPDGRSV